MNKKGEPIRVAVHNRHEYKAAGLAAKRSQSVCTVFRVVFLNIGSDSVMVLTIKCIEKCLQCATSWGIRRTYISVYAKGHDKKDDTQHSSCDKGAISYCWPKQFSEHHDLSVFERTSLPRRFA